MLWRIPSCIGKLYLHSEKAQVLDDPSFSELLIPHLPVDLWQSTSCTVRWGLLSLVVSPLFIQLWFLCSPVVFRALHNLIQERNLTHVQGKLLWPLVPYFKKIPCEHQRQGEKCMWFGRTIQRWRLILLWCLLFCASKLKAGHTHWYLLIFWLKDWAKGQWNFRPAWELGSYPDGRSHKGTVLLLCDSVLLRTWITKEMDRKVCLVLSRQQPFMWLVSICFPTQLRMSLSFSVHIAPSPSWDSLTCSWAQDRLPLLHSLQRWSSLTFFVTWLCIL